MENVQFPTALWLTDPAGDFEHDGVVGLSSFDANSGVDLEIPIGSVSDDGIAGVITDRQRRASRLYGLCQSNEHITLIDASGIAGATIPGFVHENWHAQKAIISKNHFFETDPVVSRAVIHLDGLFQWCRKGLVRASSHYAEGDKWLDTNISASSDALEEIAIYEGEDVSVFLEPAIIPGGGMLPLKTLSLTGDYYLDFRFSGELPTLLDAIDNTIVMFRDFLSLLMGFRAEILSLSFTSPDAEGPFKVYAPFVETHHADLSQRALQQMPFLYPQVKDGLQEMIERWFSFTADARRASNIMLGIMANEHIIGLDSEFLASASAFEALSRVGRKTEELSDEEFNQRLDAVKKSGMTAKIRKWVLWHLKYANFVSADKLAEQMLSELEPYSSFVVPDIDRFKQDHRVARNAYVHQNDDLGTEKVPEGQALRIHTDAVLFLIYGKVLNMLGIPQQSIIKALQRSSFYWANLGKVQKAYRLNTSDKPK